MGESCSKLPSTLSQPVPARFSPTCFLVRRAEYTFHTRDILLGGLIKFSMSVARFSCVSPTRIGIRRAVLVYSFENFTIWDKKKNGKADKIHFAILKFEESASAKYSTLKMQSYTAIIKLWYYHQKFKMQSVCDWQTFRRNAW